MSTIMVETGEYEGYDRAIQPRLVQRHDFKAGSPGPERISFGTLVCVCGNDRWQVGQGDWITYVKCPACGIETTIHDG